jgi:hypothetical protein
MAAPPLSLAAKEGRGRALAVRWPARDIQANMSIEAPPAPKAKEGTEMRALAMPAWLALKALQFCTCAQLQVRVFDLLPRPYFLR